LIASQNSFAKRESQQKIEWSLGVK